jgi:hypothetical protein
MGDLFGPTISGVFHDSSTGYLYRVTSGVVSNCGIYGSVADGLAGQVAIYHADGDEVSGLASPSTFAILGSFSGIGDPSWCDFRGLFCLLFYNSPAIPAIYANNAAAVAGGLISGQIYRTGTDPDHLCVVH